MSTLFEGFWGAMRRDPNLAGSIMCFIVTIASVVFIFLVEVWEWVTYILQLNLRGNAAEVERMHLHRADESWQSDLLEPIMDECSNHFCTSNTIRPAGESVPIDVDGHDDGREVEQRPFLAEPKPTPN